MLISNQNFVNTINWNYSAILVREFSIDSLCIVLWPQLTIEWLCLNVDRRPSYGRRTSNQPFMTTPSPALSTQESQVNFYVFNVILNSCGFHYERLAFAVV